MKLPLVSVIIPTYNAQDFIEKGINSLLTQTYPNIEIIIVDDRSTDNTLEFIEKKYSEDHRIKIIKKTNNSGPANSRNIGIKEAKGKYIALLDSDDYYMPEKLEKQVSLMEANSKVMVCSTYLQNFGLLDNIVKFPVTHSEIKDQQLLGCPVAHPAAMFRASFLKENKLYYNEEYRYSEDYEFFTRILRYKDAEFFTIAKPLYYYRITGNQASFVKKRGKLIRNEKQLEVSKSLHYKVFSKLVDKESELYIKKWIEVLLGHQSLMGFNDLKTFLKWSNQLVIYNEKKGQPFSSSFLQEISKRKVKDYFLLQKELSWKILFQYLQVFNQTTEISSKYRFKYILKCLFFLKH